MSPHESPHRARTVAGAGPAVKRPAAGRFIGRGSLALRSLYWLGWLSFSRRATLGMGVDRELVSLGVGALWLVAGASVLVGLIATFQVAYRLADYGATVLSAKAIGWFALRELGPIVAAVLVVARSASAIAGEFAAMAVNAELDALRAMGIDPVKYLVVPKLAALLIALPALTILSDGLILVGGWVGNTVFLDYSGPFYVQQMRESLTLGDIGVGLGKSVVFAMVIAIVASDEGLGVERRVGAIGGAATRAVVRCMIGVLAADTLVNAVFYFIPGLVL